MSKPLGLCARALYGSPPMVGERSPKPSMWVRFLPSVLLQDIASNSTLAPAEAGLCCADKNIKKIY